jgi:kumamolisin
LHFTRIMSRRAALSRAFIIGCFVAGAVACSVQPADPPPEKGPLPASVYDDLGAVNGNAAFHAIVSMKVKDAQGLDALLASQYDPSSSQFRKFISADEVIARFSPSEADVDLVRGVLEGRGLKVARVAHNRLMLEISGTIAQYNAAFQTVVHLYVNKDENARTKALSSLYAPLRPPTIPAQLKDVVEDVIAVDPAVEPGDLSPEAKVNVAMPEQPDQGLVPDQISKAYGYDKLAARGAKGKGATIGLVIGSTYKMLDAKGFWKVFNITREEPVNKLTSDVAKDRVVEAALDVQWAGALAPEAKMIVYTAPDIHEASLLFAFNEAIGLGEVDVLSDSFSHSESTVSRGVANQYEASAKMAAAIGMTVVAASGDSGGVDVPATVPHVTAVGGTQLTFQGDQTNEVVWNQSGAGRSRYFPVPGYQAGPARGADGRAIPDVSMNAQTYYWVYHIDGWHRRGGTSFAAPVFAAMIAVIDGERKAQGKPNLGFLNPILYGDSKVQRTFRDVTDGATGRYTASQGWDFASGWGTPNAPALADALK